LRDFGVIGCTNWKAAKTIRESAVEEQSKKQRKRMNDGLLQFF
jgi:hypothetical protein